MVTFFVQLSNQAPGDALKRGSGTQKLAQGHLDAMPDMDLALQKRIERSQSAETETPKMQGTLATPQCLGDVESYYVGI